MVRVIGLGSGMSARDDDVDAGQGEDGAVDGDRRGTGAVRCECRRRSG
jgi:hypothetical protein